MTMNSQDLSKERVLIVGCGDIGQRVARYLPNDLYQTTGLRRHPPADSAGLEYVQCDSTDAEQLAQVLAEPFAVIILTMTPSARSDEGYERAYVGSCRNLLAGLQHASHQPRLIMFVSSTAVYGQTDGSWVDETSPTQPHTFSGTRLLEAEKLITNSPYNTVVVRFSGIYGPGRNRLIEQVREARASASTDFTNRIHADDGARAIVHLIELNRQQYKLDKIYLVTDCTPSPMIDVVTWLAAQMQVTNFLSSNATNERGNKRCSNQRLLSTGFTFWYPSFTSGYLKLLAE